MKKDRYSFAAFLISLVLMMQILAASCSAKNPWAGFFIFWGPMVIVFGLYGMSYIYKPSEDNSSEDDV